MMDDLKEADRIKDRLRACKSRRQVEEVANEERAAYRALADGDGLGPVLAIQIGNLKSYMIKVALRRPLD